MTNDPNDPYDKGAPDYQTGEKKNFKFQVICAGVKALMQAAAAAGALSEP